MTTINTCINKLSVEYFVILTIKEAESIDAE